MSSTVQEAAGMVTTITVPSEEEVKQRTGLIDNKISDIKKAQKGLLPVEKAYATPLYKGQIDGLETEKKALQDFKHIRKFAQFPQLSLEVLTWRDKKGMPKLVPFSLESANWTIQTDISWRETGGYDSWSREYRRTREYKTQLRPNLPAFVKALYQDVMDRIETVAKEEKKKVILNTVWSGLIPDDVKQAIRDNEKTFDQLLLIAEPTKWEVEKIEVKAPAPRFEPLPVRNPDPLLVGSDGQNLWLIKQFDVTPLEHYVASEFTTKV